MRRVSADGLAGIAVNGNAVCGDEVGEADRARHGGDSRVKMQSQGLTFTPCTLSLCVQPFPLAT